MAYKTNMKRTSMPQIGAKAPDFEAMTTFGPMKLADLEGQWVVLFSHPGDFTPVCTTEFLAFTKAYPYFKERNTQLVGLSVDSQHSHLGWVYNIFKNTGVQIPFPIIADGNKEVSKLYGMISEAESDTSTVRSVFIIDDKGILRAILYYPMSVGRNIPEILRLVEALQYVDTENVVAPANWVPGSPAVIPPPQTYKQLTERMNQQQYPSMDWYLAYQQPDQKAIQHNRGMKSLR